METILKKEKLGQWVAALQETRGSLRPRLRRRCLGIHKGKLRRGGSSWITPTLCARQKGLSSRSARCSTASGLRTARRRNSRDNEPKVEPAVVFGVRPCDGARHGAQRQGLHLRLLRSVLSGAARSGRLRRPGLQRRRPRRTASACRSAARPHSEDGLDVLMTELDGRYHVKALTAKGKEHRRQRRGRCSTRPQAADSKDVGERPRRSRASIRSGPSPPWKRWPRRSSATSTSPLWDELAKPASAAASAPISARAATASTSTTRSPASRR